MPGPGGDMYMYGYVPLDVGESSGLAVFVGRDKAHALRRPQSIDPAERGGGSCRADAGRHPVRDLRPPVPGAAVSGFADCRPGAGAMAIGRRAPTAPAASPNSTGWPRLRPHGGEVSARDRSLQHRDAIMGAITRARRNWSPAATIAHAIPRILQTVGTAIHADRVLVLETHAANPPVALRYAWHGPAATIVLRPDSSPHCRARSAHVETGSSRCAKARSSPSRGTT